MILLNDTFCVDRGVADEFVAFVREVYIPMAQSEGCYNLLLSEMRGHTDGDDGSTRTFALQMRVPGPDVLDAFKSDVQGEIMALISRQWGLGVAVFESQLNVVAEGVDGEGHDG